MFDDNTNNELYNHFNLEEKSLVFKSFSKDKSSRMYGWKMEFFIHFFELMGQNLLEIVEEARMHV